VLELENFVLHQLHERWSDGRFMAREDWEQIDREITDAEYMRHAAGGFARAASGLRAADGTSSRAHLFNGIADRERVSIWGEFRGETRDRGTDERNEGRHRALGLPV
jgi:hypothetical protein